MHAPVPTSPTQDSTQPSLLLTVTEVAEQLKIGRTAVYALIRHGELPSLTIGRSRRVPRWALDDYIERRLSSPTRA